MTRPTVVIVGPLGSGRTAVGRALADQLGVELVETEDLVSAELGMSFDQAVLSQSPARLASVIESVALGQLRDDGPARIVTLLPSAAVESVFAEVETAALPVARLTASIAELARRVGLNAPRSAGMGQPRAAFAQMVKHFEELYAPLSPTEFVTEGRPPHTVAIEIMDRFALQ